MSKLYRLVIIGILTFTLISACETNSAQQLTPQVDKNYSENVRIVEHALGTTQVPVNPQRVVVLDGLDAVLSLKVKPIGSNEVDIEDSYLKNISEGIESVDSADGPNLEAIVALEPDLILGTLWDRSNYELLSQIAPTVIAEVDSSGEWKRMLSKYGEALGKTERAEQVMADYYARIEDFQAQMGDLLQKTEVSIVYAYPDGRISIYLEDSFCGTVVADAGLPRPPAQTNTEQSFSMDISKELFKKADGDVIFVWTYGRTKERSEEGIAALRQLRTDPLWSELNAVKQGKVYDVPGYWIGTGPIAANLVLDDLFKYLVDSPSQAAQ